MRQPVQICGRDRVDMLDPVARIARAIRPGRRLIPVDGGAHGAIAHGMGGDLQAAPVCFNRQLGEVRGINQRLAASARPAPAKK